MYRVRRDDGEWNEEQAPATVQGAGQPHIAARLVKLESIS